MEINTKFKIICDNCEKILKAESINNYKINWIQLHCNDTGYGKDDYYIDFCNLKCLKTYKIKLEKDYSQLELEEISEHYLISRYLTKN